MKSIRPDIVKYILYNKRFAHKLYFVKAGNNNSKNMFAWVIGDVTLDVTKCVKEWIEWVSSLNCFSDKINVLVWCVSVCWWHDVYGSGIRHSKYYGVRRKSLYLMDDKHDSCVCKSKK